MLNFFKNLLYYFNDCSINLFNISILLTLILAQSKGSTTVRNDLKPQNITGSLNESCNRYPQQHFEKS